MLNAVKLVFVAFVTLIAVPTGVSAGQLAIEEEHLGIQGLPTVLTITADSLGFQPGRFDLVVAINQAADGIITVEPGQMLKDCGWEYFNYRVIPDTNPTYDLWQETHLLSITGVAAPGGTTPSCYGPNDAMELASIRLWNSHYRDYECHLLPVRFFWRDCRDNTLTDATWDTVHTGFKLRDLTIDSTRTDLLPFPGFGLPADTCGNAGNATTARDLICFNGGIDLPCVDSIETGYGDINLNGRANEIGDAILFAQYFLYGVGVFTINAPAQIAATDVNADGIVLSIPDLVFLLRLISGDNIVNPKLAPSAARAQLTLKDSGSGCALELESDQPIGAAYFRLVANVKSQITAEPIVNNLACGQIGDTTTVLLADFNSLIVLSAGSHELLRLDRNDVTVADIEVYDTEGQRIRTDISGTLPGQFELYQNYPNPFNPETHISFLLRQHSRWTLTILNTLGQTVRSFDGADKGVVDIVWKGNNATGATVSSGVYYYRLQTPGRTETKLMVLLR